MKGTWRSAEKVVRPAMVTFQLRRWRKAELRENVMRRRFILIITAVLIACIGGTAWRLGRQPQASPHFSGMLSNKRIKKAENLSEKNRNAPIDGEDRHERPERVEY